MTALLQADDYRRLLAVIETAGRHAGTAAFRGSVLDALDEYLGYRGSALFLAGPPRPPWRAVDGVVHGFSRLEEYATLWSSHEPFAQPNALARLARGTPVAFEEVYRRGDSDHRDYMDRWLLPQRIEGYMLLWLDTGLPRQGYLSLLADQRFGARDWALLMALRPHLQFYLRRSLPEPRSVVGLSGRELEVARLIAAGQRNEEVARALGLRVDTVKKHASKVMAKLQLRSRTQVALALGSVPDNSSFVQ